MNLIELITAYDGLNKLNMPDEARKVREVIGILVDAALVEANTKKVPTETTK